MLKNLLFFVKYPSVAGIICAVWVGSAVLLLKNHTLPVMTVVFLNMLTSVIIAWTGFRVSK